MFSVSRVVSVLVVPLSLMFGGCEPSWRTQFPKNSELYDRTDHRRFGKVIDYDAAHDFHNGTGAEPAILIEKDGDHTTVWGACATCSVTFDVKVP